MDMAQLGDSLLIWIINIILPGGSIENILSSDPMVLFVFLFASLVLVLMTVSFLFKFILKLVDR